MTTCRFYSLAAVLALTALTACAVRTLPPPTAAAAAPLFATAVADVARMARDSNEGRFEALTAMLEERGIAFEVEPFSIVRQKAEPRTEGRNVIVTIPGRTPEIVVGAHYDAAHLQDGTLSKGAVDNAASAVILVRLAETLARARSKTQIRVVFFDMEELGLRGSEHYVQAHRERAPRAMINLDVNGFGDTIVFGPRIRENAALFQAAREACIAVARGCVEIAQMPPSDDVSFREGGIPAVSIATVTELQAHQLWLLMSGGKASGLQAGFTPEILRTIHTTADTPALIDGDAMARAYRVALGLIRASE